MNRPTPSVGVRDVLFGARSFSLPSTGSGGLRLLHDDNGVWWYGNSTPSYVGAPQGPPILVNTGVRLHTGSPFHKIRIRDWGGLIWMAIWPILLDIGCFGASVEVL